jgi:two-component system NtrC family sensor kinase
MLGQVRRSLVAQLLLILLLTAGLALAASAALAFRAARNHLLDYVRSTTSNTADLVRLAAHDGMLLNRPDVVQTTLQNLVRGPAVAAIRVYDKKGAIVMSAHDAEVGQHVAIDSETCQSCHAQGRARDVALLEKSALAVVPQGPEVLRHLSVIQNEKACARSGCHEPPSKTRILGVLDVEVSMRPLQEAIGDTRTQIAWITAGLIGMVGLVLGVFLRRVVQRPVAGLKQGTRRIAAGDLDTRIEVSGEHELARLGQAFNRMAEELSSARREVTEWSQTLEEKVVEKTDELRRAQRQVLHMEKMSSLGKLSATVAHELNNPITGMLNYTRLVRRVLEEQPLDGAVRTELDGYLSVLQHECVRCGSIVQNLLVFARRSGADMTPVDVNEIIDRSLMLVRHHLEIAGIRLHREPFAGDPRIVADPGQILQALVALLVNAVEAIKETGDRDGELSVGTDADAASVTIHVADSGGGIPPDVLPRIFEPFFSTKDKESGVGLGLAVVYGIVQRHGGDIDVDTAPGRGTTFHLRLPRQPPPVPVETQP